jgi:hypothetical protein
MKKITLLLALMIVAGPGELAHSADSAGHDVADLLALHEKVMQAHRVTDIDMLMEDAAADYIVVNRGEVLYPSLEERKLRLGEYFAITQFDKYEDSIPPVVKVSDDGSLAWLIARVSVSGVQDISGNSHSIEFVSAWIELYENRNGQWIQVGNVSNFKP